MTSHPEENVHDFDLRLRSTKIEDLCLDFTLPGYPDYALNSESQSKMVSFSMVLKIFHFSDIIVKTS